MNQSTEIRRATADDASFIAAVLRQAFEEYEAIYTRDGFEATTPDRDRIRARLPEGPVWVAMRGATVVGTVSAVSRGSGLYIRSMAVLPTERGRGIGVLLLRRVEVYAREHGLAYLFLSTTPFLSHAIRLYEQFGFQRSDEGPHDLFGTPLFTMSKTLG